MSRFDDLDRALVGWMETDAAAPAPAGLFERVVAATSRRRPRPTWLAGVGSAWVGEDARGDLGYRIRSRQVAVFIVGLLILGLLGAMLLVGAGLVRPVPPDWPAGRLAYATLGGDVFTADPDGSDPIRVAGGFGYTGWSPRWSPDGRFLLYSTNATYVVDLDGDIVLSTEGCCAVWSPDGTMIASAIGDDEGRSMTVVITGIDGAVRTRLELPGPINYLGSGTRIYWTPDGRAITLTGAEWPEGNCCDGLGAVIPIDGSSHSQLPVLPNPYAYTIFSRDGSMLVGNGQRSAAFGEIVPDSNHFLLAAVDGSVTRPLVPAGRVLDGGLANVWSPDDRRVVVSHQAGTLNAISAIDVATGDVTPLATIPMTEDAAVPMLRAVDWDAASDLVLFERVHDLAAGDPTNFEIGPDLWVVRGNGTVARLLVEGAYGGSWQPSPRP
jgi:hypothetical protein